MKFIKVDVSFDKVVFDVMDIPTKTNLELILFCETSKPFR